MELENRKKLEKLKNFRESVLVTKEEKIIDIKTYGAIDFTNDFIENPEDLFVVQKEVKGEIQYEFYVNTEKMGEINKEGILSTTDKFRKIIDNDKILSELQGRIPTSLKNLEEIIEKQSKIKDNNNKDKVQSLDGYKQEKEEEKLKPDIEIDINKQITNTQKIGDFIPEIKQKKYDRLVARRIDNTNYQFYGITKEGKEEPIDLEMTEGSNPKEDMVSVNSKGNGDANIEVEQALYMVKFKGKPNEGLSIRIGEMGIPEIDYWRRTPDDKYINMPVSLRTTNQKEVATEVQRHMDTTKTTESHLKEDIQNIEEKSEEDKEIPFEELHSQEDEVRTLGDTEIMLRKAAKECKVSYKAFLEEYNKTKGNHRERIEESKEAINEQYIGERGR